MTLQGKIEGNTPLVRAQIGPGGRLRIGQSGRIVFVIDTGFTGGIALTEEMLKRLDLDFVGYDTFTLATGDEVELPMFLGQVLVGARRIETSFILGENLLGMEFLASAFDRMEVNFARKEVHLASTAK